MAKARKKQVRDHWDHLAKHLRNLARQMTNERMDLLHQNLHKAGFADERIYPLSTRNADNEIKYLIMNAVCDEIHKRREGSIQSPT